MIIKKTVASKNTTVALALSLGIALPGGICAQVISERAAPIAGGETVSSPCGGLLQSSGLLKPYAFPFPVLDSSLASAPDANVLRQLAPVAVALERSGVTPDAFLKARPLTAAPALSASFMAASALPDAAPAAGVAAPSPDVAEPTASTARGSAAAGAMDLGGGSQRADAPTSARSGGVWRNALSLGRMLLPSLSFDDDAEPPAPTLPVSDEYVRNAVEGARQSARPGQANSAILRQFYWLKPVLTWGQTKILLDGIVSTPRSSGALVREKILSAWADRGVLTIPLFSGAVGQRAGDDEMREVVDSLRALPTDQAFSIYRYYLRQRSTLTWSRTKIFLGGIVESPGSSGAFVKEKILDDWLGRPPVLLSKEESVRAAVEAAGLFPTPEAANRALLAVFYRLKPLGWREAKSLSDAMRPGSNIGFRNAILDGWASVR
jgi:hypothetical protein